MGRILLMIISALMAGFVLTCNRADMYEFATMGTTGAEVKPVYVFSAGLTTGSMLGPTGADQQCRVAWQTTYPWLDVSTVRAMIGTDLNPLRLVIPSLYWASPVMGVKANGTIALWAQSWESLWNPPLATSLSTVTDVAGFWWTGSTIAGFPDPSGNCGMWSDGAAGTGMAGDSNMVTNAWVTNAASACSSIYTLMCVAW